MTVKVMLVLSYLVNVFIVIDNLLSALNTASHVVTAVQLFWLASAIYIAAR